MVMPQSNTPRSADANSGALAIIRSTTASCHAMLEKEIDWMTAMDSAAGYVELLQRFLRVVEPLEHRIEQHEPVSHDASNGYRAQQLRRDIEVVRHDFVGADKAISADDTKVDVSMVADRMTAWGALYVLEGSALGGQILSRQVQESAARWPVSEAASMIHLDDKPVIDSYFVGRGAETGRHWRAFCERINTALPEQSMAETAAGAALRVFELFHSSLTGKKVCVRP